MLKAITRLTNAYEVLDHLADWLVRFPEAGETPEFGRRLDDLELRLDRLVDTLQPTERTRKRQQEAA